MGTKINTEIQLFAIDDPVEQLVKQGSIAFTPTALGAPVKPELAVLPALLLQHQASLYSIRESDE